MYLFCVYPLRGKPLAFFTKKMRQNNEKNEGYHSIRLPSHPVDLPTTTKPPLSASPHRNGGILQQIPHHPFLSSSNSSLYLYRLLTTTDQRPTVVSRLTPLPLQRNLILYRVCTFCAPPPHPPHTNLRALHTFRGAHAKVPTCQQQQAAAAKQNPFSSTQPDRKKKKNSRARALR